MRQITNPKVFMGFLSLFWVLTVMLSCCDLQSSSRTNCSDINLRSFLFLKASWEEEEWERSEQVSFQLALKIQSQLSFSLASWAFPCLPTKRKNRQRRKYSQNSYRPQNISSEEKRLNEINFQPWRKGEGRRSESGSITVSHTISKEHCQRPKGHLFLGLIGFPLWPKKKVPLPSEHPSLVTGEPGKFSEATCKDLWVMQGQQHFALCFLPEGYPA